MKIAVWHNLPSGGGKRALYYHLRGLVERGHTAIVWYPQTADEKFLPLRELCETRLTPLKPSFRGRLGNRAQMEKHCSTCATQMQDSGADVVFANCCQYFAVSPIAKYSHAPTCLYLQEPFRLLYESLPRLPWEALRKNSNESSIGFAKRYLINLIRMQKLRVQVREERANAEAYDRVLVNSYFSKESVLRAYGLEASVCYLGVDVDLFKPLGLPRESFVLSVGSFHYGKGPDRIITALASIPAEIRPNLVWISNFQPAPSYLKRLSSFAEDVNVNFELLIGISDIELIQYLNRCVALVYGPRLEPFGFAPLEANACETPVVAIAEGGVRETITDGENGILVTNSNDLGDAIRGLIENRTLAAEIGRRGRSIVEKYWTWPHAIDRLESALQDTAARGTSLS